MHLKELKQKAPAELVQMAEELGVEGASTMRRQDLLFTRVIASPTGKAISLQVGSLLKTFTI